MEHVWETVLRERIVNAEYWRDRFLEDNAPESAEHWAKVADLLYAIRAQIWERDKS